MQKRHGRILYDKNALLEEQFKRRIKDMENERRAVIKKSQDMFAAEKNATYNARLVNGWVQNVDMVNEMVKHPKETYQNGYANASMPNGTVLRHGHLTVTVKRNDDFANDTTKAKSRAESYHASNNRNEQMASHRENWDLVRQRSQSTDALPRKGSQHREDSHTLPRGKASQDREDSQTYRSANDAYDYNKGSLMYPDTFQEYHDALSVYRNNEHRYNNPETDTRDRHYEDNGKSPRRNYDTYGSLVTERDARESDRDLYKNRDESRFRYHPEEPRKPPFDNRPEDEKRTKTDRVGRSITTDLNEEIDRILKERNKEDWPGTRIKEEIDPMTYREKEQVEKKELQKLWAINDAFQKDLEKRHPNLNEIEHKSHAPRETRGDEKEHIVNDAKQEDKDTERDSFKETQKDSKSTGAKAKSTKEIKDNKKSRFKYDNRVYIDSSKHKSKKKDSKKAKRLASKTSASTRITQETEGTEMEGGETAQDGQTDATSAGTSSPMKRYNSQIDRGYRQFDKYTNSDVYPLTPELSATHEDYEDEQDADSSEIKRTGNNSEVRSERNDIFQGHKNTLDNKSDTTRSERVKSLKSISSRPTVDSRTVQTRNKDGGGSRKTFSVLAGDVGMIEQYQNMSGKVGNLNQQSVKVA